MIGDCFGQRRHREKRRKQKVHGTDARCTPERPRAGVLPARLRHTRDEPARSEFSEGQARNLEPANKRAAAAADFATIDHPGGAGIAWQLGQAHIIFLRFELSPQGRVFFHGRALAFVAIDPGRFRHKGTRNVAGKPGIATAFSGGSAKAASHKGHNGSQRLLHWTFGVRRWTLSVCFLRMFPLKSTTFPATATALAAELNDSLRDLFGLTRDPVTILERSYPHLVSLIVSLTGAKLPERPPAPPSVSTPSEPALTIDAFAVNASPISVGPASVDFQLIANHVALHR